MGSPPSPRLPFDIDSMMERIREALKPFPRAALFDLFDEGYTSTFEQLLACIVSIRTRDETTVVVARRLFATARTPAQVAALDLPQLEKLLYGSTFPEPKARQIRDIAGEVIETYNGELPCREQVLLSFRGVGPKCANLVMGIVCGASRISVDIHVHRVTNRWGYVQARAPEGTMRELEKVLPERYWVEINRLLVPFGKHICTGTSPRCSTCPVLEYCRQVGVTRHR